MLYFVPVFFFIGTGTMSMMYPIWLPEPVVGCIATLFEVAEIKHMDLDCYREDGTILKMTISGKYKL